MPDTVPFARRLWRTPLRDLARGRVTGRLDWRARLAASGLPEAHRGVITRVVLRTRLWRLEKADVAAELTAHFADGLGSGADAAALVRDFGDERTSARLIRRAKKRARPLVWKAWRLATFAAWGMAGVVALLAARFYFSHPVVSVDYVARLNASIVRTPEADRAWPVYRRAMLGLGLSSLKRDETLYAYLPAESQDDDGGRQVIDATPADAAWPVLTGWLDTHAADLALVRQGAAKPLLGFIYGPGGSANDPQFYAASVCAPDTSPTAGSLISLILPYLNELRGVANLLDAEARVAAARGDGRRATDDVAAMLGLARQSRGPFVVSDLVGLGVDGLAFERVARTLRDAPQAWTDAELAELAHRLATVGGDTPASLIDIAAERASFHDVIQRTYSDDGHGDGHLTADGMRTLVMFGALASYTHDRERVGLADMLRYTAAQGVTIAVSTRADVLTEYDRLMDTVTAFFSRPMREATPGGADEQYADRIRQIKTSAGLRARYWPVGLLAPSVRGLAVSAERTLGRRDGIVVALALELYHRQHGDYPATLDALVPALLPRVPADRIDGAPVRYRLQGGRPVVYSVGVDRDDDAGRPAKYSARDGRPPAPTAAAQWPDGTAAVAPPDGDWVLYDGRLPTAPATGPANR